MKDISTSVSAIKLLRQFWNYMILFDNIKNVLYSLSIVSTFLRFPESKSGRSLSYFLRNPMKHHRCRKLSRKFTTRGTRCLSSFRSPVFGLVSRIEYFEWIDR